MSSYYYECNICQKILKSDSGMRKHQKNIHGRGQGQPYNFSQHLGLDAPDTEDSNESSDESSYHLWVPYADDDDLNASLPSIETHNANAIVDKEANANSNYNPANTDNSPRQTLENSLESALHSVAELSQQILNIQDTFHNYQRVVQNSELDNSCCICMERERTHILIPCGHFVLCHICAGACAGRCPVCKSMYTDIVRVYC